MTVIIDSVNQTGPNTHVLNWYSDQPDPTFYIYQDGTLIDTTQATSKTFSVSPGEALVVEVLDNATDMPETAFPGRLTLGWYATPKTQHYRIEKYNGTDFVLKNTIREDGRGYYQHKTHFLADVTDHVYRVIPVGINGNNGDPLTFSVFMVRHPDPPTQNFDYNPITGIITIN